MQTMQSFEESSSIIIFSSVIFVRTIFAVRRTGVQRIELLASDPFERFVHSSFRRACSTPTPADPTGIPELLGNSEFFALLSMIDDRCFDLLLLYR
jgi:hypothetical protein